MEEKYSICTTENLGQYDVLKDKKFLGTILETPEIVLELNKINEENNILKYAFENTIKKSIDFFKDDLEAKKIINIIENLYYEELKQGIDF